MERRIRDQGVVVTVPAGRLSATAHITRTGLTLVPGATRTRMMLDRDREIPLWIDLPVDVAVGTDGSEDHFTLGKNCGIIDVCGDGGGAVARGRRSPSMSTLALLFAPECVGEIDQLRAHVNRVSQVLGRLHSVGVYLVEADRVVHGVVRRLLQLTWLLGNLRLKPQSLDLLLRWKLLHLLLLKVLRGAVATHLEQLRVGHNVLG